MSLPILNLDDKTFETLVQEAKKRIPIYAPAWTDHNLHDPGITLIELFAWMTEMQIYRLNKVTNENQWKFLKLMGIEKNDIDKEDEAGLLEEAIPRARRDLKTVYRAVTSADYEYLLLKAPGSEKLKIARVKAIPRYHPNQHREVPGIVTVVVVPQNSKKGPQQDNGFLKAVHRYLRDYRLPATELFVTYPQYIEVSAAAAVTAKPQHLEQTVKERVTQALKDFLDPLKGGPDRTGWPFGRPVYLSEIYQAIDNTEGVDFAKDVRLFIIKKENEQDKEIEIKGDIIIPPHSLVCSGEHKINGNKQEEGND